MCTKHQFDGDYSPNVESRKSALIFTLACISENLCKGISRASSYSAPPVDGLPRSRASSVAIRATLGLGA
jgi:hypothetical protein